MLSSLQIENVAVIQKANVHFEKGLNVLTGETGAGKSILIDSINAILGNRTSKDLVRTGAAKAVIRAAFEDVPPAVLDSLEKAGYERSEALLLSREITAEGKSTCRINGMPATAAVLRELCGGLININGQHDSVGLLNPARHEGILDAYAQNSAEYQAYYAIYRELVGVKKTLDAMITDESEKQRRIDLLSYQVQEIDDAALTAGEEQTLESRKRLDTIQEVEQENLKFNRALRKLYNELTRERETELNKAREEANEIVDMALSESDRILQVLHAKSQLKPHEIIEAKAQLKKLAPETVDLSKNKVLKKAKKARAPKVGDEILVISYGQRGTLVKQLKDGRWEAQVGLIKMTLQEKEFNLIKAEKEAAQTKKRQVNVVKRSNTSGPRARLDLRGKRYEEAMQELDGFIDQALLNNMAQVDIIHGIGTGVIREGVTKYLRRNKHVKSFEYAPQNAGGSGATIVTFKG